MKDDLIELKPCPFCGPRPGYEPRLKPRARVGYDIVCGWCEVSVNGRDMNEVLDEWNTRPVSRNEVLEEARLPLGWLVIDPALNEESWELRFGGLEAEDRRDGLVAYPLFLTPGDNAKVDDYLRALKTSGNDE